ncbi:MAG TPA: LPS assembly protein LptD [Candidatus Margulisiibacteriota bacterium]|nr:LPS assembly protein LptD [Candidatus Margulisiibacteriota bacterium]
MGASRFLVPALILSVLLPFSGRAQLPSPDVDAEEIGIDAEQISYDQKTNTVVARGKVVITRGDTELRADEVKLNRATNEAEARGNVTVTNPEGTMTADVVSLNLDEETGVLTRGAIEAHRTRYSLRGERIEKGLGQSYHIENGQFTTCHCTEGPPSWSISGGDVQVNLEGYGIVRDGTFNVLGVPILYIPRGLFPIQRQRQTGFLIPRFGFSNTRGFQTLLPFYWAIDKSQDATMAFDMETSKRVGVTGDYRYVLSRETHGDIGVAYFNEIFRGSTAGAAPFENTIPQNRWSVGGEHQQPLGSSSQAYADVFMVGDDLFLREINTYAFEHARDVAIRTLPFTESHAGIIQEWDRLALRAEGTYYQNLEGGDSQTLQRAPEVDLWGQQRLVGPVLGELNASLMDYQRATNVDGVRFDAAPAAEVPLPLGRFAFGTMRASFRETAYHLFEQTISQNGMVLPEDRTRETVELGADVSTILNRVYPFNAFGLERVKHTVEPEIQYLYIPPISQGELPLLDGVDRINRRNMLTYGVTSRLIGRFSDSEATTQAGPTDSSIRELARVSLMQSFDVSREIQSFPPSGADDHFSDVDIDGRVNPSRALSLQFHLNYDTGNNSFAATRIGFFIQDPRQLRPGGERPLLETRTSAAVSYRFLAGSALQEVDSNLVLRVTDWAGFLYSGRYDVVNNRFLDNFVGLRLISMCDCWSLDFAVVDRTNPHEVEARAQLTLVGFGSSKPSVRSAGSP